MKIAIVGGGMAGWLSALFFSRKHPQHDIVVIESPDLNPVGVGESTTGMFLKLLFNSPIDINFKEFIQRTDSTPKLGIHFKNWAKLGDEYLAPLDFSFTAEDPIDSAVYFSHTLDSSLFSATLNGRLLRERKVCYTSDLSFNHSALHLDSLKTIKYLRSITPLETISANVIDVIRDEKGNVTKLITTEQDVEADFFVDCTGMARVLRDKSDWISFKDNLPMNSATVFETEHNGNFSCATGADAASSGWMWKIPTKDRYGQGYVYNDAFLTEDDSVKEILELYPDAKIKKTIKFDTGKLNKACSNNVLSIGLAYHFLEPLQATNIHLTLLQLEWFTTKCMFDPFNKYVINRFNSQVDHTIENFKDYINCHYATKRDDTKFWKWNSQWNHLTDNVRDIVESFKVRGLFSNDFHIVDGETGISLWTYTLLGSRHINDDQIKNILQKCGVSQYAMQKNSVVYSTGNFINYTEFMNAIES